MYKDQTRSWIKHFDFMVLDVLCMQLCFILSYWAYVDFSSPYELDSYQFQAVLLFVCQLIIMLFSNSYQGILRRNRTEEVLAVLRYASAIFLLALVYLFALHQSIIASRMQMGLTYVFFLILGFGVRELNKLRIQKTGKGQKKSLVLITSADLAPKMVKRLTTGKGYLDYFISSIILLDGEPTQELIDSGIPIDRLSKEAIDEMSHNWVDEVFILQPENVPLPPRLMDDMIEMGMVVNYSSAAMSEERWPITEMRKIGDYRVITSGIQMASVGQVAIKRIMDFIGGIVGSLITLVMFVFIAPIIKIKSPGPVFFVQKRVGRNGKVFNMYKFRSMHVDAEERKKDLMDQNAVEDGMMFKIKNDPRIIDGDKKRRNGKPGGFGHFIRRTSIDEFPQFFNVLKGEMSMVGTRPPTLDEWEKYDLGHRARMSVKPGITGLWQVSGRSKITDFHKVVRLDREYIEHWSLALDLKILLRTVVVVVRGRGAL